MWAIIVLVLLAIAAGGVITLYNRLVGLRERAQQAWSDIDVQLKRRHDLIPNLVETVKGYATHEQETFQKVTQARSRAESASGPREQAQAEGMLSQFLGRLLAVAEDYPELQADENFRELQNTLEEVEKSLSEARRYYNAVARDLNMAVQQFPSNIVAGWFGFEQREFFELEDESERDVPEIQF